MTKLTKVASLADEFVGAIGVPTVSDNETAFGEKIMDNLTEQEERDMVSIFFGALGDFIAENDNAMDRKTIQLADIFSAAAIRAQVEDDVIACVPLNMTDKETVKTLETEDAKSFASIVRSARTKNGLDS